MTTPSPAPDDALLQAASLAFALVRFEEGAAHPRRGVTPPGMLRIGEEAYSFLPSWRAVPRAEVPAFLAALPSPALLVPTTTRGVVSLTLLHELEGERARWARKTLANQREGLDELAGQLGLAPESHVLLEFDDERHVVTLAVLRLWSERFCVQVGWNMGRLDADPHAAARLNLLRSDGHNSWGPGRPPRA